ncbi:hypothetical protein PBCV1_a690R [Paramecium bursaria Chlorella virus 1]|uniref:Uncharacterized protein n=1 Tax=Paramecium bursaria Chlorella virus 1 TaxID=10506 RepID=Q89339_PBCV1|nr:hypothetical protein PBCV1_a004L [Paramecium bursaria Chlorella virus 1]NP_049046.1 hypothetical protein PBCV1_a690R [Paramecium bursaria Chlorella virus 1]AAC96372.1 hypothetical protein [Paramecium bursaria Chlorella virus 1]AAC97058.1 hypothetical protein [Paramecium bursaria Chlorella virus 1]
MSVSFTRAFTMISAIKNLFTNDKPIVVETTEPIDPPTGPKKTSSIQSIKKFFTEHTQLYRVGTVFVVNTPETIEPVDK